MGREGGGREERMEGGREGGGREGRKEGGREGREEDRERRRRERGENGAKEGVGLRRGSCECAQYHEETYTSWSELLYMNAF